MLYYTLRLGCPFVRFLNHALWCDEILEIFSCNHQLVWIWNCHFSYSVVYFYRILTPTARLSILRWDLEEGHSQHLTNGENMSGNWKAGKLEQWGQVTISQLSTYSPMPVSTLIDPGFCVTDEWKVISVTWGGGSNFTNQISNYVLTYFFWNSSRKMY